MSEDSFAWSNAVLAVSEQAAITVYQNTDGQLVIRSRASGLDDEDQVIVLTSRLAAMSLYHEIYETLCSLWGGDE